MEGADQRDVGQGDLCADKERVFEQVTVQDHQGSQDVLLRLLGDLQAAAAPWCSVRTRRARGVGRSFGRGGFGTG
eukprot:SAG31_NODE_28685_length_406_cov_1.328990_1_plen_74_part_10